MRTGWIFDKRALKTNAFWKRGHLINRPSTDHLSITKITTKVAK